MDAARTNVTDISHYSRERRRPGGEGPRPLDECLELSADGLSGALAETLPPISARLLNLAEKAMGLDMYHLHMDALELVRDHGDALRDDFRAAYVQRFNQACRREPSGLREAEAGLQLSLVEPDDLEEHLAAETLANAIHNTCSEELFALDKRMGILVNDPDLQQGDNPLGPEVIGTALLAALELRSAPIKVRLLLVSLFNRQLPERVKKLYQTINQRLVQRGVLPTIRVGLRKNGRSPPPADPPAGEPGEDGDLFAILRRLLGGGRYAGAMPPIQPIPAPPMPGETVAVPTCPPPVQSGMGGTGIVYASAFMQGLDRLQHGRLDDPALAGIDPAALAAGRVNVLHGLRNSGIAAVMGPMDAMTLDIVAMVFDYILDDARIPDAIKALIGRLQIPVLKVAMLDKAFFSQKTHPARQLLDALAEAAVGWDAAEGHDSDLYRKVEELVQHILNQFDDRVAIFAEALDGLNAYLAEEKRTAARQVSLGARVIRAREQAAETRAAAHREVHARLLGQGVPEVIRAFLGDYWEALLAEVGGKAGMDGHTWQGALQTADDLIWSVQPKTAVADRKRLVDMLPGLLNRLDEGMRCLALPGEERDRFFTALVKCHAEAVKAGQIDPHDGDPLDDPFLDAAVAGEVPRLDAPAEFEPVPLPVEAADDVSPDEGMEGEVSPAVSGADDPSVLKRGNWIEYRGEDGAPVRAKLSWVSPLRGIYLFTNRLGQRAMCIGAAGLAAKLRAGEVTLIDDAPLVEKAVNSLVGRLQRRTG